MAFHLNFTGSSQAGHALPGIATCFEVIHPFRVNGTLSLIAAAERAEEGNNSEFCFRNIY